MAKISRVSLLVDEHPEHSKKCCFSGFEAIAAESMNKELFVNDGALSTKASTKGNNTTLTTSLGQEDTITNGTSAAAAEFDQYSLPENTNVVSDSESDVLDIEEHGNSRVEIADSGVGLDNVREGLITGCWGEILSGSFDNADRTFIDTPQKLEAFLPILLKLRPSTKEAPELALDSEGWNLGKLGTLTILQLRVRSLQHTFVFDVFALGGKKMFETEGSEGQSLKKVLQSNEHVKLWWDIRQDQEALLHHFGILVGNRIDVQLMELAVRSSPCVQNLRGLCSAVWIDGHKWMSPEDVFEWVRQNTEAKQYFRMSNYDCFNQRPLSNLALEYSAGDVDVIERLYDVYCPMMTDGRWKLVHVETDNRILRSMLPYPPKGNHRAPESFALLPINCVTATVEETDEEETPEAEAEMSEDTAADSEWGLYEEGVPEWEQQIMTTVGQSWGEGEPHGVATIDAWGEATTFVVGEGNNVNEGQWNSWDNDQY